MYWSIAEFSYQSGRSGGHGDATRVPRLLWFSMSLAGFQTAAARSAGAAAASQSALFSCGTGDFRAGFFGVRIRVSVCVFFSKCRVKQNCLFVERILLIFHEISRTFSENAKRICEILRND